MAKIVVIDDEDLVRNSLVVALQRTGFEVISFNDARPALERDTV